MSVKQQAEGKRIKSGIIGVSTDWPFNKQSKRFSIVLFIYLYRIWHADTNDGDFPPPKKKKPNLN